MIKKCRFCKKKGNLLHVNRMGIYGAKSLWVWSYHSHCLNDVACEPEKYSTRQVDMAIEVVDCIKEWKEEDERRNTTALKRCEYLKQHCIS